MNAEKKPQKRATQKGVAKNNVVKKSGATKKSAVVKAVTIGKAGEEIEDEAFKNKKSLVKIVIADGVTEIGNSAFAGCVNLESVTIPKSVKLIRYDAFNGCIKLSELELAEGIELIGQDAFNGCVALTKVVLPSTVTDLRSDAFKRCANLEDVVIKNEKAKMAMRQAFPGCPKLKPVVEGGVLLFSPVVKGMPIIPSGVTKLGESLFASNDEIKKVVVPAGVKTISEYCFQNCKELVEVKIDDGVSVIERDAFCGCKKLKKINIPAGVKKLCDSLFAGCESLSNFVIPSTVKEIESELFEDCTGLKSVDFGLIKALPSGVCCGCASLEKVKIPKVAEISYDAFKGTKIRSIRIPHGVKAVESSAFEDCASLESVELPAGLKEIEYCAFAGCGSLKKIVVPSTVEDIGTKAFSGCTNLSEAKLSSSLLDELNYPDVFKGCEKLPPYVKDGVLIFMAPIKGIAKIPIGVTEIDENVFDGCGEKLVRVELPDGLKKIGRAAFRGCNLATVEFPDTVIEIGSGAFVQCNQLKSVKLPTGLKTLPNSLFSGCKQLTKVELPEGLESIYCAFTDCTHLKEIVVPSTVRRLSGTFGGCLRLNKIEFKSSDVEVENGTFDGCILLREMILPRKVGKKAKLIGSKGYQQAAKVVERNSKLPKDKPLHIGHIEFWSYSPTIGTAWVDVLDEVDDELAESARDEGDGWGALDVSDIGGELRIDGKVADLDFEKTKRRFCGNDNTWGDFRDKIGIYAVDIDKASCTATFAISGDFDSSLLTFFYTSVIGPGYYQDPEGATINLLDHVEYDGVALSLTYGDERNNKGCEFTVFNQGRYAKYKFGCDVNDLEWHKFPVVP